MKTLSRLPRFGALLLVTALPLASVQAQEVVATVNGEPIHREDIKEYQQEHAMGVEQGKDEKRIIDELVARELVLQDAEAKNLEQTPEVQDALSEARRQILMSAAIQSALEQNPVTEKEMKSLYDERIGQQPQATEYKARHILVEDEAKAEQLISQLNQGADFAALAEEHSTGPSAESGGDLGWFSPQQMVPPFSQAVQELEKGEVTQEPVQTRFGWHVIKLEDTRAQQPPSFEEVKPQLERALQQQRVAMYLENLRKEAKVEYKN